MAKKRRTATRPAGLKDYAVHYADKVRKLDITQMVMSSFKLIFESWGLLFFAALVDFLFLISFSLAATFFQLRAFDHLYALLVQVGTQTGGVINEIQNPFATNLGELARDPVFTFNLQQALYNFLLLFVAALILWCIFQSISWWLSHKIKLKHQPRKLIGLKDYMGRFLVPSAFFFLITLGVIVYTVTKYIDAGLVGGAFYNQDTIFYIYVAVLLVIWYFGFISYSLAQERMLKNIKDSIVLGVKKVTKMLPTLVFLVIFYYILFELWTLLFHWTNNYVSFFFGLVVFMPSITFARVLFIKAADKLRTK